MFPIHKNVAHAYCVNARAQQSPQSSTSGPQPTRLKGRGELLLAQADALEADSFEIRSDQYVAIITNGKGIIPEGTRISVPKNKVKWDNGNPTGHGIIFIGNAGQTYCYVTPGGTASW